MSGFFAVHIFELLLRSSFLWAAFGNTNSTLLGITSAGLGGAGTSLVEDSASAAFYNPASLAAMKGESFSASAGIYKKFETQYGDSDSLVKAALRTNQGFFRALPSSTGSIVRPKKISVLADWTFALSILVPEYSYFRGDIKSADRSLSTLSLVDESLWVGVGTARQITNDSYFGATLYYTARSFSKLVSDRLYNSATDFKIYSEEKTSVQNSLVLVLGYLKELSPDWKLGVSFRPTNWHIHGRASYVESSVTAVGLSPGSRNLSNEDSRSVIPARVAVGVSYRNEDWLLAFDINHHFAAQYLDFERSEWAEKIRHNPTTNFSLGAQKKWNDLFVFRTGVFSNFSTHPEPEVGQVSGQGDRVDQLGFAANLDLITSGITFSFGGDYSGGRGHSVQRIAGQYERIEKSANVFTMLVGTSKSF